eukprot:scaffold23658_cov61-Phaeocystis_antarctica.AAC.10
MPSPACPSPGNETSLPPFSPTELLSARAEPLSLYLAAKSRPISPVRSLENRRTRLSTEAVSPKVREIGRDMARYGETAATTRASGSGCASVRALLRQAIALSRAHDVKSPCEWRSSARACCILWSQCA